MKKSHIQLWDLFLSEGTIPSKEQMNEWDDEILVILNEKVKHDLLTTNLSLLMALRGVKNIKELAAIVGYDAGHISKIFSGSIRIQSNVVCFYTIAYKLGVKLTTLLRANLADDLEAAIVKHETT